ncbi:MAG: aminopeptidase P family protein [Pseudomonadota bacterium]
MTDTSPTHFQSFDATSSPDQGPPRLAFLRKEIAARGFDGFIVPRADAFQGEYVAPCDARLAWLTGFTGSAGFAVVLREQAAIFTDGRYQLQVRLQTAPDFAPMDYPSQGLADYLIEALPKGGRVAYDPWLHTAGQIVQAEAKLSDRHINLVACENLVDRVWTDRPGPPMGRAEAFPEEVAGKSAAEKIAEAAADLAAKHHAAFVICQPDELCWLLNLRGSDVTHTPLMHGWGILYATGRVALFAEAEKLEGVDLPDIVSLVAPNQMGARLTSLKGPVRLDASSTPQAVLETLRTAKVKMEKGDNPLSLARACKTQAEIAATRRAHLRDGAAVVRFLHWLDSHEPGSLTEIDCVRALEGFRAETNALREISFDTIAGAGPNGAIMHYRVTAESNAPLLPGQLFLIDSGGQYLDGTTDITRTVPVGAVGDAEREAFTQVLQGMIAIHRARFPLGRTGRDIDALARAPLWAAGRDYAHGTGHGVGVYLGVHEGPQRIAHISQVPLKPGMILSNEPGYYREGAFGIRIENLIVVREAPDLPGGDDRAMLDFETLTFAPIDRRLIVKEMLSEVETSWLNAYHSDVARKIGPLLEGEAAVWLQAATAPL